MLIKVWAMTMTIMKIMRMKKNYDDDDDDDDDV